MRTLSRKRQNYGFPMSETQTPLEPLGESPLIGPGHTFASVTDKISAITQGQPASRRWWVGFGITFGLVVMLHFAIAYLLVKGVGIWGVNIPVAWGFAI